MHGEVELEESSIRSPKRLKGGIDTIVLKNDAGETVDGHMLADWLLRCPGTELVQSLVVRFCSHLKDLVVLKALPNLINLQVNGHKIETLNGLEWFKNGRYINIDTGKNRRRSIADIAQASITRMTLQCAKEEDLSAIARSSTIKHLELGASPRLRLEDWHEVQLEFLGLYKGRFEELSDTAVMRRLSNMTLVGCRSMERFTGDNSGVTWMVIQGCPRLDLKTVTSFRNVELLWVVGNNQEVALSDFQGLVHLKELSLAHFKVRLDVDKVRDLLPSIEKLHISGLRRDDALKLSGSNAGVSVSSGRHTYVDGERAG